MDGYSEVSRLDYVFPGPGLRLLQSGNETSASRVGLDACLAVMPGLAHGVVHICEGRPCHLFGPHSLGLWPLHSLHCPVPALCVPRPASADAASVFRGPGSSGSALLLPGVPRAPGLHLGLSLPEVGSCLFFGLRDAARTFRSLRGASLVLQTPFSAFLLQPLAPPRSFVILGTGGSGRWGSGCSSTRRDLKAVCMFSRLCRMDVSLFLQSVATSSVASASVIP